MSDSLKIAFVIDDSLDRPDGVQQHVLTLGAYFTSLGHDVHYLCPSTVRTDVPQLHSLARSIPVRFNGNRLTVPLPTSRRKIRAFVDRERFDVIHVQSPHSPLFSARVADEARKVQGDAVRIVGTFHILPFTPFARRASHALAWLLRNNVRRFDTFVAVSPPTVEFARDVFGVESVSVPNPVDLSYFQSEEAAAARDAREQATSETDPIVVSFLGRLVERKGVRELVAAVTALPPAIQQRIKVRIAGPGPLEGELRASIKAGGLEDVVTLEGFVGPGRPVFYAQSHICVFPAPAGESFGIVLIEAMAAGAGVVIGGDNPGYRSVLGDNPDVLVRPRDTASFAAALERLITDTQLRERIHAEQAQRVVGFDVARVGQRVLEIYRG